MPEVPQSLNGDGDGVVSTRLTRTEWWKIVGLVATLIAGFFAWNRSWESRFAQLDRSVVEVKGEVAAVRQKLDDSWLARNVRDHEDDLDQLREQLAKIEARVEERLDIRRIIEGR